MNLLKNKLEYLTKMSLDRKIKSKWFKIANILLAVLIIAVFNIDSIITFLVVLMKKQNYTLSIIPICLMIF